MAVFKKQGVYWIDYYVNGRRKRERIGPDKKLAETVLKKRKVEIAEGRYLEKRKQITTTFDELTDAYLRWITPDVAKGIPPRKRSWKSAEVYAIGKLQAYFVGKRLSEITPAVVEQYRAWRRSTISRFGRRVLPGTVNRELAVLRQMFNVARKGLLTLKGGIPLENPVSQVRFEKEHNERERVLSPEELDQVVTVAPHWAKPMILMAYHTGLRRGEIVKLRWDQVDVKRGIIRLRSGDTKTNEGRVVPLNQTLREMLGALPRGLGQTPVFVNLKTGEPYSPVALSMAFQRARTRAGIPHATLHDQRHTFVTNARRAGIDYFRIMAMTGHKTMRVFKRYNLIDEDDLQEAMTRLEAYLSNTRLDTSIDTSPLEPVPSRR